MNEEKIHIATASWGPLKEIEPIIIDFLKITPPTPTDSEKSTIFDFLEQNVGQTKNIILLGALTQYSTEANYRFALARLIEGPQTAAVNAIVEERSHPRIPLIYRAARTLGIEKYINSQIIGNHLVIHFNQGLTKSQIKDWRIDTAPYLDRPKENAIIDLITRSIIGLKPLSLVRIGHCEVRFIGQEIFYGESDLIKSCQIQWGATPAFEFINKVQKDIIKTISNASIIGFKNRTNLRSRSLNILDNSVLNCLATLNLLKSNQIQSSPNIHFTLGENTEFIESIRKSKKLTIISPRANLADKFKNICSPTTAIKLHIIPGEARIDGPNDIDTRIAKFLEVEEALKAETVPGEVVLVGGGVAGKIFCEIARSKGGVGIDLGSTLDAWSGLDTRGNGFPKELKEALNRRY